MERVGVTPTPGSVDEIKNAPWFQAITQRMNVYSGTANPAVAEVPENQWVVFRNTTLGEVRIWTNIAGILKKSAAFT